MRKKTKDRYDKAVKILSRRSGLSKFIVFPMLVSLVRLKSRHNYLYRTYGDSKDCNLLREQIRELSKQIKKPTPSKYYKVYVEAAHTNPKPVCKLRKKTELS